MSGEAGNQATVQGMGGPGAVPPGVLMAGAGGVVSAAGGGGALVMAETPDEAALESDDRQGRLDQLGMQLDVMVRVQSMRVRDLLALEKGSVVETIHEHTQDLPVRCGGALMVWAEFEAVEQRLAVRITRLA
jgi:flagellar motor switch/type III secretory pathway protein FliN